MQEHTDLSYLKTHRHTRGATSSSQTSLFRVHLVVECLFLESRRPSRSTPHLPCIVSAGPGSHTLLGIWGLGAAGGDPEEIYLSPDTDRSPILQEKWGRPSRLAVLSAQSSPATRDASALPDPQGLKAVPPNFRNSKQAIPQVKRATSESLASYDNILFLTFPTGAAEGIPRRMIPSPLVCCMNRSLEIEGKPNIGNSSTGQLTILSHEKISNCSTNAKQLQSPSCNLDELNIDMKPSSRCRDKLLRVFRGFWFWFWFSWSFTGITTSTSIVKDNWTRDGKDPHSMLRGTIRSADSPWLNAEVRAGASGRVAILLHWPMYSSSSWGNITKLLASPALFSAHLSNCGSLSNRIIFNLGKISWEVL